MAETFLAAFRRRDRYDTSRADARPWLYGIAIRLISRQRRAEARYRQMLQSVPVEMVAEDFGDRSAERETAERFRPQLLGVLGGLPVRDRELLLLVAWAGLTYEEAASAMDLSVGAVRSRLHRVRVRTRSALGGVNPAGRQDWENDHG